MNHDAPDGSHADDWLLRHASRAAVWNTLLLPLLALANLALSVFVRRRFGLGSGVYDVVLGLASALMLYSGLGIPGSLSKFLPEVASSSDSATLRRFLRHTAIVRLAVLAILLIPLNALAQDMSDALGLGAPGPAYLHWLSLIVAARAVLDLAIKALNAFFAQLWSNLFALVQAVLDVTLVGLVVVLGMPLLGVFVGLAASASIVAAASASYVWNRLDALSRPDLARSPSEPKSEGWMAGEAARLARYSAFTYLVGLLSYFGDMGFVAPALALLVTTDQVAVFATAFKLSFMTVTFVVAGFRGLYQPVFARLRARNDPAQIQRAFSVITRGQLLVLLPAGLGLGIMAGDYIPLLFGQEFRAAIPVAQVLIAAMFAAVVMNVPGILLTVDERYRAVLVTQAIPVLVAPAFLFTAASGGLVMAAVVFGLGRLCSALLSYAVCRQAYGARFPWSFATRVSISSMAMAIPVASARRVWLTGPVEAVTLTLMGVALFALGLRLSGALGRDEVDLIRRSRIPGHAWIVALLAPRHRPTQT